MRGKILVVDDDTLSRRNISRFLRGEGYDVDEADNGNEAAQRIEAHVFDLVLADLIMTKGNGLELLKRARSVAPDTRVLIMSGFPIDRAELVKLGASGVIGKPFGLGELLLQIKGALGSRSA